MDAWIRRLPELLSPFRVAFWLLVGVWVWAVLRMRLLRKRAAHRQPAPVAPVVDGGWPGPALVVRCLVLFNAVFLVQTVLDIRYLFGGAALPEGVSFAEYAHRGAYPLMATALLAAAFVVATFRHNGPAQRSPVARKLVYLWLIQNVFLVVSAGFRLGRYVEAYGLSRWRVAAMLWMLLVAVGLAAIIYRIVRKRSNAWLIRVNALSAILMLYACAPVNFDGFIAMFNVRHCREVGGPGVPIDLDYLASLGPEAIPAMNWLESHVSSPTIRQHVRARADRLRGELDAAMSDWRGWTWRRQRLQEVEATRLAIMGPTNRALSYR